MTEFFEAKLLEVKGFPTAYDHFLSVELLDGTKLELWDPDVLVKIDWLGKKIKLTAEIDTVVDADSYKVEKISPKFSITQKSGPIEGCLGGLMTPTRKYSAGFIDVKVAKFDFLNLPVRGRFKNGDFVRIYEEFPNQPITGPARVVTSAELVEEPKKAHAASKQGKK